MIELTRKRAYNFNPGPAALPLEVLAEARDNFVEYEGLGMSLMEISHRSREFERLNDETQQLMLELLELPNGYHTLFMGGGASAQFALVPLNFLRPGRTASYVITGNFAEKAFQEAGRVGQASVAASSKEQRWSCIPAPEEVACAPDAAYLHLTVNNTIEGSQYADLPDVKGVALVGDMTSCILGRRMDTSRFALIYAGAQKNLGPAGVTVVVVRDDFVQEASDEIPLIFRYKTFVANHSLYNTPPVHSIYMMNLVLKWTKRQGGVARLEEVNREKAQLVYDVIDRSGGFYRGLVEKPYRSIMNITWRMRDEALEKKFVAESEQHGFAGLAGHRSVGGLRASAYNAVPREACNALAEFMLDFQRRHG